jgi:hypothetical protein
MRTKCFLHCAALCGLSAHLFVAVGAVAGQTNERSACAVYGNDSVVGAIIVSKTTVEDSLFLSPRECDLFCGFIANNSNFTRLACANSAVQSAIAIAPGAAAQVSAGGVSLENTTFSGTASSDTQASQTVLITAGEHAAAYVGGIRAK